MAMKIPFNISKPIAGEASVAIETPVQRVFKFVGDKFFENYPKWALEVTALEPLDSDQVVVGAKAKQVRVDNNELVESVFEITELEPNQKLVMTGINAPYKQSYLLNQTSSDGETELTFRFELLELDVFMRPFEKLIRYAIEEGAENTVANIRELILQQDPINNPA